MLKKRPLLVTIMTLFVFLLTMLNVGSVYAGFSKLSAFSTIETPFSIFILLSIRSIWSVIWGVVLYGWISAKKWSPHIFRFAYVLYATSLIIFQLVFTQAAYDRGTLALRIVSTILLVIAMGFLTTHRVFDNHFANNATYEPVKS